MLPPPAEIARRDARRLAVVLREVGGHGAPLADGWMARDLPGSWADYAAGVGVDRMPPEGSIDTLVAFYRAAGRVPRVQVTAHHEPGFEAALRAAGFVEYEREVVLGRSTRGAEPPILDGFAVRPVDDASVHRFVASQAEGFFAPAPMPDGMRPISERVGRHARCGPVLLTLQDRVVGSGGLEVWEDFGVLVAGCVHPDARRRGVQSAFIAHRVHRAAEAGLAFVLVGSTPGGPTERNARRHGFVRLYETVGLELPTDAVRVRPRDA